MINKIAINEKEIDNIVHGLMKKTIRRTHPAVAKQYQAVGMKVPNTIMAVPKKKILYSATESNLKGQGIGKDQIKSMVDEQTPENLTNHIFQGKGGFVKNIQEVGAADTKGGSGETKKQVNKLGIMHEGLELKVKHPNMFFSHLSPEVMLKENNIVSTLPESYHKAKENMIALRSDVEGGMFPKELPYGQQRLSRHAIKHISSNISSKLDEARRDMYEGIGKESSLKIMRDSFFEELQKIAEHPLDKRKVKKSLPKYLASGAIVGGLAAMPLSYVPSIISSVKNRRLSIHKSPFHLKIIGAGAIAGAPYGAYKFDRDK